MQLNLGGEKSGHIILRDLTTTGDGVLTAVQIAQMCTKMNCTLSQVTKVELYPQCNIDCPVADKMRVINSEQLANAINEAQGRELVDFITEEDKVKTVKKESKKEEEKKETKEVKEEKVKKEEPKKSETVSNVKADDKEDLSKKTVVELKEMAKQKSIEGYSKMKKSELLEALNK